MDCKGTLRPPAGLTRTTIAHAPTGDPRHRLSLPHSRLCSIRKFRDPDHPTPNLQVRWFAGRGEIACLEALLPHVTTSLLEGLQIIFSHHLSFSVLFLLQFMGTRALIFSSDINQRLQRGVARGWRSLVPASLVGIPLRSPNTHQLNIAPQRDGSPVVLLVCSHSIPSIPVASGNQRHSDTTSWVQVSLHPPPKVSNTPSTHGMLCFVRVICPASSGVGG